MNVEGALKLNKPSVGRIVHYTNLGDKDGKYPPEQQAAIITRVRDDNKVCLDNVPFSEEYERGYWSWPAKI